MRTSNPEMAEFGGRNILPETTWDMEMMIYTNFQGEWSLSTMEVQN
jgi:hypothetical protein